MYMWVKTWRASLRICWQVSLIVLWFVAATWGMIRELRCINISKRLTDVSVHVLEKSGKTLVRFAGQTEIRNSKPTDAFQSGCAEPDENVGYRFSKNWTEPTSKFKNWKLGFRGSVFKKSISAVWGRFFTLSHSQFILQHDRINSWSIFLDAASVHKCVVFKKSGRAFQAEGPA